MLKHATPRSSPSLRSTTSSQNDPVHQGSPKCFNERSIDCEGIISSEPLHKRVLHTGGFGSLFSDKIFGFGNLSSGGGIGPVITQGRAIVRRGLSFSSKKDPDSQSVRSVKSEGKNSSECNNDGPTKSQSELTIPNSKALKCTTPDWGYRTPAPFNGLLGQTLKDFKTESAPKKDAHKPILSHKPIPTKDTKITTSEKPLEKHPSLKSLLRLPGVHGHIPVPANASLDSPHIISPDTLSLSSSNSFRSSNSERTSSRSWNSNASSASNSTSVSSHSNCSSSSEPAAETTLKIYAKCLRSDIEYKTLSMNAKTTCGELIELLLSKVRMRHRDPKLFYLTMEVCIKKWSGLPIRALLVLEQNARPAQLSMCRPTGDLRFALQMRKGGVVKVHDTVLMPGSQYKSLLISYRTTAEEVIQLLLNCYSRKESKHYYALHEVCHHPQYRDRRLDYVERPLEIKSQWPKDRGTEYVFVLRRNMTQALSLRKLFMKTTQILKEKEENRIIHSKENLPKYPNTFFRVEAEPGLAVPEDATLIDCTTTTPKMTSLKNRLGGENQEKREVSFNQRKNAHEIEISQRDINNINVKELKVLDVKHSALYNNRTNYEETRSQKPAPPILKSVKLAQRVQNSTNNKYKNESHSLRDDIITACVSPSKIEIEISVEAGKTEPEPNAKLKDIPSPNTRPRCLKPNQQCTKTQIPSNSFKNHFKHDINTRQRNMQLTYIPVRGSKGLTPKWNSVETLIDSYENYSKKCSVKSQNKSFDDSWKDDHANHHSKSGRHCEQNCKKCFYI